MNYALLNHAGDKERLAPSPAGYWLIISFEILLRAGDETVLVLSHPSYATEENSGFKPGTLCPPFVAFPLTSHERYLTRVRDILSFFLEEESRLDIAKAISTHLYLLGLTNYTQERVGEIIECKESYREPGKYKCYKVIRISVITEEAPDLVNLTDPLVLSRFTFLPLPADDPLAMTTELVPGYHGITRSFRGVPLASNLCRLLEDAGLRSRMIDRAIAVSKSQLYTVHKGWLLKCDLENSGQLTAWLLKNAKPFAVDNAELEFGQEVSVHAFFLRCLARRGFPHFYMMGDGFLAGSPGAGQSTPGFAENLRALCGDLGAYCQDIRGRTKGEVRIDFRLAVLAAEYAYGRFSLLNESRYFIGPATLRVARMEEGLRRARRAKRVGRAQRLVIDEDTCGSIPAIGRFFQLGKRRVVLRSKESTFLCRAASLL